MFLTLAVVVVVGLSCGAIATRLKMPSMTGQILGGLMIGTAGLDLFDPVSLHQLAPVTDFALGLVAVTVGGHLNWQRLRNAGRRLLLLAGAEATIMPLFVLLAIHWVAAVPLTEAALYGTVAIATAPATIIALVKETRSRGVFVKTLVAAVALNNLACIVLFEVARGVAASKTAGSSLVFELSAPAINLVLAALIGAGTGIAMHWVAAFTAGKQRLTSASFLALLVAVGFAQFFGASPLLTCLFLGLVQTNLTPQRTRLVDSVFEDFEPTILAVFFTLAGMHLSFEHASLVALLALLFVAARLGGKVAASSVAMMVARATRPVQRYLGVALLPQAGVAVGLVVLLQEDPAFAEISGLFTAVVLTAVTVNELTGPILTRWALTRSGEAGQDRSRLLDFLQEENIVTGLSARTKEEAIAQLVSLLVRSHHLGRLVNEEQLLQAVLAREADVSTCFGGGLAVPHGELPETTHMYGVMGLSRQGLRFETPDGLPVHCVVLLATPPGQRERHLQVLAAIAQTVGLDSDLKLRLFTAQSAAHAYDILHADESVTFNYYLDEPAPAKG